MRFSQPHDHGESPCLPTYHPRSHPAWPHWATLIRSDQPGPRTCSPTWRPSATPGPAPGAGTRWSPSWCWPRPRSWRARSRSPRSPSGPPTHPSPCGPRSEPAAILAPATGCGRSPAKPRSGAPLPGLTPRPWPPRSAPGWTTATGSAPTSGDGRSRSTARPCAAPAPRRPAGPSAGRDGPHHPRGAGPTPGGRRAG